MRSLAVCLLTLAAADFVCAADKFYLHPNDTVVFYGDSITDQRFYTMLAELYSVTRYPKLDARFVHSGWGGDRVTGGSGGPIDLRLERDVLTYHPTVMTIMLGMNDGRNANHTPTDDEVYFTGYRHIVETVRHTIPALRITAIEPSPFDDVTRPYTLQPDGYNAVLVKYGDWLRHYAPDAHLDVADLNTGVVAMLRKANVSDTATAQKILPDRVHPSLSGHLIMAEQLLKAWGARPVVSSVTIDAASGKVTQSDYTRISISNFHTGALLAWTQTDEGLPLPFAKMLAADRDHTLALAIRSSDVTEALNQEIVRVNGLASGRYKLTIDGETAGTWSETELAHGVNLAVLDTPMSSQAMEVRDLTVKRIDVHQQRWRALQVPLQDLDIAHLPDALKALDSVEAEVITRQRARAQPRPHAFQLAA
ncbi:MAG TPA: SGNH/GDSL hydrolase family protein, partial [Bryobacteraceae bacterium]|nr:SGNH/GDSL hydrolase family protein [Bryobacteraceae bacterium]